MRISDLSSDVCSSDLPLPVIGKIWKFLVVRSGPASACTPSTGHDCASSPKSVNGRLVTPCTSILSTSQPLAPTATSEPTRKRTLTDLPANPRSEEHTELQSLMRSSYAVFCWKKKNKKQCRAQEQRN